MASAAEVWLVGDIGGTNARFGLVSPDAAVLHSSVVPAADFADIAAAIRTYLGQRGALPMPGVAALAIAAPIPGDAIRMTNPPWAFPLAALKDELGFERLVALNAFTAVALALPHLG